MKRAKLIACIIAAVLFVAMIVVYCVVVFGHKEEASDSTGDVHTGANFAAGEFCCFSPATNSLKHIA